MSRIQDILNKAERDGTVRRVRTAPEPEIAAIGTLDVPPVVTAPMPTPMKVDGLGLPAATAVPEIVPTRAVHGARLAPTLVAAIAPDAVAAEQYRALRTRLTHIDNGTSTRMMLVTSPGRGEGKSVTAANLALAMAQEFQQRVCLIDANLRNPELHRLFDVPDSPGVADVLLGRAALDDALVELPDLHITLVPAGGPAAHPAELLGTATMRRLLDTLRSRFDRIVIDAPATGPLADVGILTPLIDSVMLVVRAGVTSKPAIHEAVATIDQTKLLGVVLNEAA